MFSRCRPLLIVLVFIATLTAVGQESPSEPPIPSVKEWLGQRTREFKSYKFNFEAAPNNMLTLERQPLLNWSNAERGTRFGATFLWTSDGRPAMIASAYGRGGSLRHELQS